MVAPTGNATSSQPNVAMTEGERVNNLEQIIRLRRLLPSRLRRATSLSEGGLEASYISLGTQKVIGTIINSCRAGRRGRPYRECDFGAAERRP